MAFHKLTKAERVRGIRKLLRSPKTPPWIKPKMREYLRKLEAEVRRQKKRPAAA